MFVAEDVDDYVRAVRAVLGDPARYEKAYVDAQPVLADWMWDKQADVLDSVYASLLP